jgi:hypothetical protein
MLNLFVMVIVEAFEVMANETHGISESYIPVFQKAWEEQDPQARPFYRHLRRPFIKC